MIQESTSSASTIGLKYAAGISGILLLGFVVVHLLGNLQVYQGSDVVNNYAHGLKNLPLGFINIFRIGLVAIALVHLVSVLILAGKNREARPHRYQIEATLQASLASRTMIYSGIVVLLFVFYHLAHFTWHWFGEVPYLANGAVDVYRMVVLGFSDPKIVAIYVIANGMLGLHLSHGISSFFQTIGLNSRKVRSRIKVVGNLLALAIALGNISIPIAVLVKCIR